MSADFPAIVADRMVNVRLITAVHSTNHVVQAIASEHLLNISVFGEKRESIELETKTLIHILRQLTPEMRERIIAELASVRGTP